MGNACTNCSACKGDMGENSEVLTVDNKVSGCHSVSNSFVFLVRSKVVRRETCKYPAAVTGANTQTTIFLQIHFQRHVYLIIRLQAWVRGVTTRERIRA